MNPRQRINTAMRGEKPDRVPVWCLLSLEHIIRHGTPDGAIPETIDELVAAECRMSQLYHFDGLVMYQPGLCEGSRVGDWIRTALSGVPVGEAANVLAEANPESWPRGETRYEPVDFYSSRLARQIMGQDHHIGGWTPCGFSSAIQWFPSLEDALVALVKDPVRFEALVDYYDAENAVWAAAQVELGGLESIQISSPYAGSTFISPRMYRRFVLPSVRALSQAIRSAGGFSYLHTCGFIGDRLEMLVETEVDGIECMDPPPLGDVTLADAKARVGDKIFLKGNLDSVNVLLQASDQVVDNTIRETIRVGKPGGGFILSTACSVAPDVPPERVHRIAELGQELGAYQ